MVRYAIFWSWSNIQTRSLFSDTGDIITKV